MSMDQPKRKTIKKLLCCSQFQIINLISFSFITTSVELGANAKVTKCCPRNQVISVADGYICAYYGDRIPELYPLRNRGISDNKISLSCLDLTKWTVTDIENTADMVINGRNSCVDLLYDDRLDTSHPIVFQCHHGSNGNKGSKIEGKVGGVKLYYKVTRFETLRMCCGKNRYFDRELRECRMRTEEVNVTRFLNFLSGYFDFVTVVPKPLTCKHTILDYIVNVTTDIMVLANGRIEVSSFLTAGI